MTDQVLHLAEDIFARMVSRTMTSNPDSGKFEASQAFAYAKAFYEVFEKERR